MEVIVVGAGIWGLASAYACAKRGDTVSVYDAASVGCGASGGLIGAMAPHTPDSWNQKKQFQFEALDTAESFWAEVDATSALASGYAKIGRLQPLSDARALALTHARNQDARTVWENRYTWDHMEKVDGIAQSIAPMGVAFDSLSARVFPRQAVASLATACTALGVKIYEGFRIESFADRQICGPWGKATADAVIVATGAEGFEGIAPYLPFTPGVGIKGQAALLAADLTGWPLIFADGIYIVPHESGSTGVGSTSEISWDDAGATDHLLTDVIARARVVCPHLGDAPVLQTWAGLRPRARRRDPMLGALESLKGVYVAMGAFKIGFGLAHRVGAEMAAMVHQDCVKIPASFTLAWHMAK